MTSAVFTTTTSSHNTPARVMIVDDSKTMRHFLNRALSDPNVVIVGEACNGCEAVDFLRDHEIDVIILDILMPIMDGVEAIPKLISIDPNVQIIIASTLTTRNAEISFRCLDAGAADYLLKPSMEENFLDFRDSLLKKVKIFAQNKKIKQSVATKKAESLYAARTQAVAERKWSLRPEPKIKPYILAFGCSTGGPQALMTVLKDIKGMFDQPIIVTQHMPPTFTTAFAEHLEKATGCPTFEGKDGMPLDRGSIYIAPGDFHMVVAKESHKIFLKLLKTPPENFCRPAVDPMFRSVAELYRDRVLGIILTGIGQDGLSGAQEIVKNGGHIIAQDEETSVVWGMPGAVTTASLCSAVEPLDKIQSLLKKYATGFGQ